MGACEVTCRGSGPPRFGCSDYFTQFQCTRQPPPKFTSSLPSSDWAVIDLWTDGRQTLGIADATVLAASSPAFESSAVLSVLGQENDRIAVQRERARTEGVTVEQFLPGGERRRVTAFLVRGGWEAEINVAAEGELATHKFPLDVERGTAIYFRGVTDETNEVFWVDVLYARKPELADAFVEFIRNNLRVRSRRNPDAPVEFYGSLGIAGKEPGVWFTIAGAIELGDVSRPAARHRQDN